MSKIKVVDLEKLNKFGIKSFCVDIRKYEKMSVLHRDPDFCSIYGFALTLFLPLVPALGLRRRPYAGAGHLAGHTSRSRYCRNHAPLAPGGYATRPGRVPCPPRHTSVDAYQRHHWGSAMASAYVNGVAGIS